MKKVLLLAVCFAALLGCTPAVTPQETAAAALEEQGDKYYSLRNEISDKGSAITNMDKAAADYLKAFNTAAAEPVRLYKYLMARDFKYRYLYGSAGEKKKEYMRLIKKYEPFKRNFSGSKEFNYSMAILWGRRGEITQDTFDTSNLAVAKKIKKYAEALYGLDRKFHGYAACKILGRLHYKVPNVAVFLTWPDRKKSKSYLEEMMKGNPGDSEGMMFLADTIWDTGDKKTAEKLYKQVMDSKPRKDFWFYDTRAIKLCGTRMKELKIR